MAFDVNGNFVRPGAFSADKANGQNFTDVRADQEFNEIADGLTALATRIENVATTGTSAITIANVSGLQSELDSKQNVLGFTPVNIADVGETVAPINTATGKIDAQYLPDTSSSTSGLASFNGRTAPEAVLTLADVTSALTFTPAAQTHLHAIADVTGLATQLAGKQATLGFTPANAVHGHDIADITNLQTTLDTFVTVSTSTSATQTTFPVGHYVMATVTAAILKNATRTVYTGISTDQVYTTTSSGSLLVGTWISRGVVTGTTDVCLFQRIA